MPADIVLSDTLIGLGLLGWAACTAAAIRSKRQDAMAVVLICWAVYAWGAGAFNLDAGVGVSSWGTGVRVCVFVCMGMGLYSWNAGACV